MDAFKSGFLVGLGIVVLIFLLSLTQGCGLKVHTDPIKVEPIQVNHTVTLDTVQLETFYQAYCQSQYTLQVDIDHCVSTQLAQFWDAVNKSVVPGNAVMQTGAPPQ